ncbi:MAG: hypothetical protein CMF60_01905 [Magnetococcales bacterium]|nr:hypothetical protein [Magnetococcales bacterium]|tara:strand:+ start:3693 stop:5360 length:1668 start_codon:yes stop_codon:yes gene_type:complete
MNSNIAKGWLWAAFSVLVLWGCNNVMIAYSAQVLHANYLVYTCSAFVSCSFFLLLIGGKGPLVRETLRSIDTWAFGLIMLVGYVLTLSLFSYVSSTEGSLLQRISLLFSVFVSWVFLSRTPTKGQWLGVAIVTIGLFMVCRELPSENRGVIYLLMFLEGLALTARMFVAEIHRPHKQAMNLDKDPRAKARVVGFVMFIISTFFLCLTALIALLQSFEPLPIETNILPTLADFTHSPSIFAGLIAGVVLLAPLRLIEFSSANTIKTENFLALAALSSISTFFWEWLTQTLTGLSLKTFSNNDVIAGLIITVGCLVSALSVAFKGKTKTPKWQEHVDYTSQDIERVDDSREIVANTLEHFKGDVTKVADALNVHKGAIEAILMDEKKVLAFKPDNLKSVARKYRHNVAASDSLTGLANRAGFMTALKGATYEADVYSIIFIDLDKFKPINDTHGHDAGDFVLRSVGERLKALFPTKSVQTRLGGDEFCVLLLGKLKHEAEALMADIQKAVAEPFTFEGQQLQVTASIGVASYPNCATNPEELLKLADKNMYRGKHER